MSPTDTILFFECFSPRNIKAELDYTLGEPAPSFTTKYWVAEFKRGRTSCQDEHRCGQPNEVTTTETVKKIHKMVLDDRRIKVYKLVDMVGISKRAVNRILTENLNTRNKNKKQRREDVSRRRRQFHLLARSWHQIFGIHVK